MPPAVHIINPLAGSSSVAQENADRVGACSHSQFPSENQNSRSGGEVLSTVATCGGGILSGVRYTISGINFAWADSNWRTAFRGQDGGSSS